jgi:hypothetical protein
VHNRNNKFINKHLSPITRVANFIALLVVSVSSLVGDMLVAKERPTNDPQNQYGTAKSIDDLYRQYAKAFPSEGLTTAELAQFLLDYSKDYNPKGPFGSHTASQRKEAEDRAARVVNHETWGMTGLRSGKRVMAKESFRKYAGVQLAYANLDEEIPTPNAPRNDFIKTVTFGKINTRQLHISYSTGGGPGPEDQSARPAQFSWTTQKRLGPSTFAIDGAISYDQSLPFNAGPNSYLYLAPALEVHSSNAKANQEDSIAAKLSLNYQYTAEQNNAVDSPYHGHFISLTPNFQTDRKSKVETYGADLMYSPVVDLPFNPINLITYGGIELIPHDPRHLILDLQPAFGIEGGYATRFPKESVYSIDQDFARFLFKLHADLEISNNLWVSRDYNHRTLLTGSMKNYDFVSISPIIYPKALSTIQVLLTQKSFNFRSE